MDQIFDRLGNLLRSWITPDEPVVRDGPESRDRGGGKSGDSDFDDAMDELDALLSGDREKSARLDRERESMRKAEEGRRKAEEASRAGSGKSAPNHRLAEAYARLGLPSGAPFADVKAAYKRLLKEHHPDKYGSDATRQKKATETASALNGAYRLIETWITTGSLRDE